MSGAQLLAHLEGQVSTVCRCWAVTLADGRVEGFTDHDGPLDFEGIAFRPEAGMSARALVQGTGLSIDNSEALGILSSAAISEADIERGLLDGAGVRIWLVNWQAPEARLLRFAGTVGEIRRGGGVFQAELRGLTEPLNQPQGRVFQRDCTAVLGDARCRVDLSQPGYTVEVAVQAVEDAEVTVPGLTQEAGWFARGSLTVLSGEAEGLSGAIKSDRGGDPRRIALWQPLRAALRPGDRLRLQVGCAKRFATCRQKFDNLINFQGFPDLPSDDWLAAVPRSTADTSGGSRR